MLKDFFDKIILMYRNGFLTMVRIQKKEAEIHENLSEL
ncbi:hypothetical protein SAFG77S_10886 [Streptomyces afghaniensis]|jgi:ArsR family metal-binding transcriptional regulator